MNRGYLSSSSLRSRACNVAAHVFVLSSNALGNKLIYRSPHFHKATKLISYGQAFFQPDSKAAKHVKHQDSSLFLCVLLSVTAPFSVMGGARAAGVTTTSVSLLTAVDSACNRIANRHSVRHVTENFKGFGFGDEVGLLHRLNFMKFFHNIMDALKFCKIFIA